MSLCSCRVGGTSSTSSSVSTILPFSSTSFTHRVFSSTHVRSYVPIAFRRRSLPGCASGGCYRRENTWNAPEIYLEFTEVLYATESRAPRFLTSCLTTFSLFLFSRSSILIVEIKHCSDFFDHRNALLRNKRMPHRELRDICTEHDRCYWTWTSIITVI